MAFICICIIVNVSTLLLSSSIIAINRVLCLRENIQRYPNRERKGPKSIQIEDSDDNSSAVNLAYNYSATWDPSLSAKLRTIKEMMATYTYHPCDNYHASKYAHAHKHTKKSLNIV